jgi:hypothetical protein
MNSVSLPTVDLTKVFSLLGQQIGQPLSKIMQSRIVLSRQIQPQKAKAILRWADASELHFSGVFVPALPVELIGIQEVLDPAGFPIQSRLRGNSRRICRIEKGPRGPSSIAP